MEKEHLFEMHANMDKWRKEMAEIIKIAFLNSNNIDEFVMEADAAIRKKFSMPYSLSLETLYYSLHIIWSLSGQADGAEGCWLCGKPESNHPSPECMSFIRPAGVKE